ncbi:MAG: caspase domain-containing protein [Bradyrhizobium sp.]|uniref:caspase family protein n=1 Tax=Bradyrhizobium sp. TaxID=376 RepID=UPI003D0BB279
MRNVLVIALATLVFAASAARAEKRVALVIGNSAYQNVPFLPNPINDAADVRGALERLGFAVKSLINATHEEMRRGLVEFGRLAGGADLAVVFFAGHGIQVDGENWLIPTDAQLLSDLDIRNEAIALKSVTDAVSITTRLGLVILDACRSNPFLRKMQVTNVGRSAERGLVRVEPANNILVAYAARDGTTAQDGSGRNSPFTKSLLRNLETPDLEVTFLFRNVRDDVLALTGRAQEPFLYGSLSKDPIYLKGTGVTSNPTFSRDLRATIQDFEVAARADTIAGWDAFLAKRPQGTFAELARERRSRAASRLARPQAPAAPPAQPSKSIPRCQTNVAGASMENTGPCRAYTVTFKDVPLAASAAVLRGCLPGAHDPVPIQNNRVTCWARTDGTQTTELIVHLLGGFHPLNLKVPAGTDVTYTFTLLAPGLKALWPYAQRIVQPANDSPAYVARIAQYTADKGSPCGRPVPLQAIGAMPTVQDAGCTQLPQGATITLEQDSTKENSSSAPPKQAFKLRFDDVIDLATLTQGRSVSAESLKLTLPIRFSPEDARVFDKEFGRGAGNTTLPGIFLFPGDCTTKRAGKYQAFKETPLGLYKWPVKAAVFDSRDKRLTECSTAVVGGSDGDPYLTFKLSRPTSGGSVDVDSPSNSASSGPRKPATKPKAREGTSGSF